MFRFFCIFCSVIFFVVWIELIEIDISCGRGGMSSAELPPVRLD